MVDKRETHIEYAKNSSVETRFETYLRYSNEKAQSSPLIASLLDGLMSEQRAYSLLDVGSGTGDYIRRIVSQMQNRSKLHLTLLEPNSDFIPHLERNVLTIPDLLGQTVVNTSWEDSQFSTQFDFVLAAHLYHIPPEQRERTIGRMVETGKNLFLVLRGEDDIYNFKMRYIPLLEESSYQAQTILGLRTLIEASNFSRVPSIEQFSVNATLEIPIHLNLADAQSIIEFLLKSRWEDIPHHVQKDIIMYLYDKNGIFSINDGLLVVTTDQE